MPSEIATFTLENEDATARLARALAPLLSVGDTLRLEGPLGAGKSALAREIIRMRAGDPQLDVPSPTFALVQVYDLDETPLWHMDLYRLEQDEDILDLGFEEAETDAICLIEWPDKAARFMSATALTLVIEPVESDLDKRHVTITAADGHSERWRERLSPMLADN